MGVHTALEAVVRGLRVKRRAGLSVMSMWQRMEKGQKLVC